MAKYFKKSYKKKNKKYKNKRSALEKLAYDLGKIERGKSNPDSKVYTSYHAGKSQPKASTRKPLI